MEIWRYLHDNYFVECDWFAVIRLLRYWRVSADSLHVFVKETAKNIPCLCIHIFRI